MAIPSVNQLSNLPGGGVLAAMNAVNDYANKNHLRKYNQIRTQYAPITAQAEAASKLAYANLMGPQFLAKIMGNDSALGNMSEDQKRNALSMIYRAGSGQGGSPNSFGQQQYGHSTGTGQPGTNSLSGWFTDKLKGAFGGPSPQQNIMAQGGSASNPGQYNGPVGVSTPPAPRQIQGVDQGRGHQEYTPNEEDPINHEIDAAFTEWLQSPQGKAEIAKGEQASMPSEQEILEWKRQKDGQPEMKLELTEGQRPKSYAENTGEYKGTVKQGEESGKYRAQAQKDIGQSQLALSNSGASLDRMASIIKNPIIQEMRSKVPFFQDKQLGYLEKMGTPEQKKLIGDFITTGEQIIASGVQAFGGKPLVREFDLLQRQKINRNDPVHVAEGKLQASIALHDIAEQKNEIINDLLGRGVNEADAVKQANKMVNVSAIEKKTNELLRDKPTEADISHMAKKYNISSDEVKKRLKAKGLM